jgi:CheY-like chemotaxis protein
MQALEEVARERPDVVLMDIRMPRLSGEGALQRLKADPATANLPVIAITASSMAQDEGELRRRFDGYVRKPYSKSDLLAALSEHFELRPAGDGAAAEGAEPEAAPVDDEPAQGPAHRDVAALAELEAVHRDELPRLRASLRMREIDGLAPRLAELAASLQWYALADYAADLARAVDRFDVASVKRLLDQCPRAGGGDNE